VGAGDASMDVISCHVMLVVTSSWIVFVTSWKVERMMWLRPDDQIAFERMLLLLAPTIFNFFLFFSFPH
jgi:hypothetical protein